MNWQEKSRLIHALVVKRWPVGSEEDQRFLSLALAGEVGSEMLPAVTVHNTANAPARDAVLESKSIQSGASGVLDTDREHLAFSQSDAWVVDADVILTGLTPFRTHVGRVCSYAAEPQVSRIHAGRVVPIRAIVQHVHALGDWPVMQLPRKAVGKHDALIRHSQTAVPSRQFATGPKPTGRGFLDFGPEPF